MKRLKRMDGEFAGDFPAVHYPVSKRYFSGSRLVCGDGTARFGGLYMNSLFDPFKNLKGKRQH